MPDSIHSGHRERLRKRFFAEGLSGFAEHEVLELVLFFARPRGDMNPTAHRLIERFGSFSNVLDAPVEELMKVEGVGKTSATLIKMIPQLGGYYLDSRTQTGDVLNTTERAGEYFIPKFLGKKSEEVYLAALDDRRKVLRCTRISKHGIVNAVHISIRKIVAEALAADAAGVLLAHNHPGGNALPSDSDKLVTFQAYKALKLVSVQLVDHIIVADDDFVSLADSGLLAQFEAELR